MNSISSNLNIMIKAAEKASKIIIRDFGELEKLQVSSKGPADFVIFLAFFNKLTDALYLALLVFDLLKAPKAK